MTTKAFADHLVASCAQRDSRPSPIPRQKRSSLTPSNLYSAASFSISSSAPCRALSWRNGSQLKTAIPPSSSLLRATTPERAQPPRPWAVRPTFVKRIPAMKCLKPFGMSQHNAHELEHDGRGSGSSAALARLTPSSFDELCSLGLAIWQRAVSMSRRRQSTEL